MDTDLRALDRAAVAAAREHMGAFAWPTVLTAALTYLAFTPLHEAAHGNIHSDRPGLKWVNELVGFACAQVVLLPHATHRLEHMAHHRYTNDPERDPDFLASKLGSGIGVFSVMALRFFWNGFSFAFQDRCTNATPGDKALFLLEVAVALARNTSSLIAPVWMRPIRWFWMNQDLHSIHHLFPRVPFYR